MRTPADVRTAVEALADKKDTFSYDDRAVFAHLKQMLDNGQVRAAEPDGNGGWRVNTWVKQGILLGFRMGQVVDMHAGPFPFFDKDTYPLKPLTLADGIRIVPGGSAIREGSYVAPGVVVMPPAYVNVGAYVDEGTMVDSHALVGSCAQIGKRVHLSAAVQVGGVLEPVGALPVVVEDDAFIGGGCGVYEGTRIGSGAVLAPGVQLTGSTTVFDLVRGTTHQATTGGPLVIPPGAVVVPGSRAVTSDFGRQHGLNLYAPVIVKYRDERTDRAVRLEDYLR
jgi:2,3,4,5-tetrahydropyridine-2,6-dicarboxylate N-succinyltransferase